MKRKPLFVIKYLSILNFVDQKFCIKCFSCIKIKYLPICVKKKYVNIYDIQENYLGHTNRKEDLLSIVRMRGGLNAKKGLCPLLKVIQTPSSHEMTAKARPHNTFVCESLLYAYSIS